MALAKIFRVSSTVFNRWFLLVQQLERRYSNYFAVASYSNYLSLGKELVNNGLYIDNH